jgi:hypothetical protein
MADLGAGTHSDTPALILDGFGDVPGIVRPGFAAVASRMETWVEKSETLH